LKRPGEIEQLKGGCDKNAEPPWGQSKRAMWGGETGREIGQRGRPEKRAGDTLGDKRERAKKKKREMNTGAVVKNLTFTVKPELVR